MKLREIIKEIADDNWLEITEQTSDNYRSYIGRVPKKYIVGEELDYQALYLGKSSSIENYAIFRFLLKNPAIVHVD